jgi:2-ketocyclohexanecarboxyl-CoA hydrolase
MVVFLSVAGEINQSICQSNGEIIMSNDDVLYEVKDDVATITINRPKSLNAFTGITYQMLKDRLSDSISDRNVGVIVLTGVGERAFCVGGDINWEKDAGGKSGLETVELNFHRLIVECPKPVITRVNGYAIGAGNIFAYFSDFTVAADHAIFGQNGPRVGSPASGYPVGHAANVLGHKRAREMWMLCRRYTAQQALDWGLINSVVPMAQLDAEVRKYCDELLSLSPTCLRVVKASFYEHMKPIMDMDMKSMVAKHAPNYFNTGEQKEGANAFLEKRKPNFRPYR